VDVHVRVVGVAQTPQTLPWEETGASRLPEEALLLAERLGVTYPEEVKLVLMDTLPSDVYAAYLLPAEVNAHELWPWTRFLNRFGDIVIRLKPLVLDSDEAILAVLAHEAFELNQLFELLPGGTAIRAEQLGKLINRQD